MAANQMMTYSRAKAIVTSDTVNIVHPNGDTTASCEVYVGGAGNVVVETSGGDIVTFTAVPVGSILPVSVKKVTTASTATLMIALWR